MKLIYMGTPDFAVPTLEALRVAGHEIVYAVTQPDAVRDRGKKVKFSPVKAKALELGIEVLQPETIKKNTDFLEKIEEAEVDAIIVAAYGKLLPKRILEAPKYGCLNIHGSLLPRFRGAAPIQAAIIEGDKETGITIMFMEQGLDTGDMISKSATPIDSKTGEELHDELAEMGARLMVETLDSIEAGNFDREKQDDAISTYAPMISKEDGHINFSDEAKRIERTIRAFDPWPGTYAKLDDKVFKFWKAEAIEAVEDKDDSSDDVGYRLEPGRILAASDEGIDIATGKGVLRIEEIQAPGKKRMSVKDYLRGNLIVIDKILR